MQSSTLSKILNANIPQFVTALLFDVDIYFFMTVHRHVRQPCVDFCCDVNHSYCKSILLSAVHLQSYIKWLTSKKHSTVKILKFGTPQTIAIIVLKLVKFDVTLH